MSKETVYNLVPQDDIDRLEKARLEFFELLESIEPDPAKRVRLTVLFGNVSSTMWQIAHRRYESFIEVDGERRQLELRT